MFQRFQLTKLKHRMEEPRQFIQVVAGPRQVGKTTLVRQFLQETSQPFHFASADEQAVPDSIWLEQQWDVARLKQQQLESSSFILAIDEIQKIGDWSNVVKANWDRDTWNDTPIKVILLGSAQVIIHQGLTESLAGRFELIPMPHWSLSEMEEAFGISPEEYVWFGGYPGAAPLIKEEARWKAYVRDVLVETTISKDVLQLTQINKPALLRRLFELSSIYSGKELSYNKMLGQLQDAGNTTTLSHYLQLLQGAGMVMGIEKYAAQPVRTRASSPKLQVLNNAFLSIYSGMTFNECRRLPERWGQHVESAVGAHLANAVQHGAVQLYYWRSGNREVDFVLRLGAKLIGIEVKSGKKARRSGMKAFQENFQPDRMLLVGTGGLSWQAVLRMEVEALF